MDSTCNRRVETNLSNNNKCTIEGGDDTKCNIHTVARLYECLNLFHNVLYCFQLTSFVMPQRLYNNPCCDAQIFCPCHIYPFCLRVLCLY